MVFVEGGVAASAFRSAHIVGLIVAQVDSVIVRFFGGENYSWLFLIWEFRIVVCQGFTEG